MTRLEQMLQGSPYQGYVYAYPHKTAYRRLPAPAPLKDIWARERRQALCLYLHIPFCEMRCGFCNLFTQARPKESLAKDYLTALRGEADMVREALDDASFARVAVGGGTPTFVDVDYLAALFDLAADLGAQLGSIPISVETSPATAEAEKLALLRKRGVTRVSIGIQSFVEAEVAAVARPQKIADVERALAALAAARFPTLNIDLIYGLPTQTVASWLFSLERALEYSPQELYLYPLYVRPLTGLGKSGRAWDDLRLECYRTARELLLERGFQQISMRMFQAPGAPGEDGPVYCCQEDGMVGIGCGARSYTRGLHYSREYAVGSQGIRTILADYLARPREAFAVADYGFRLNRLEQRRRHLLQSILQAGGLDRAAYRRRFDSDALDDFPELKELHDLELAVIAPDRMRLMATGLERSDVIGPWLISAQVKDLMASYDPR